MISFYLPEDLQDFLFCGLWCIESNECLADGAPVFDEYVIMDLMDFRLARILLPDAIIIVKLQPCYLTLLSACICCISLLPQHRGWRWQQETHRKSLEESEKHWRTSAASGSRGETNPSCTRSPEEFINMNTKVQLIILNFWKLWGRLFLYSLL